jgi:signal peptidase II
VSEASTRGRPLRLAFAAIAAAVVVADQATKAWLLSVLPNPGDAFSVVGDVVRIVHWRNAGGLFGLLQGQALPFAVLSLGVMVGLVVAHDRGGRWPYMTVALGLLLGGAVGNFIDRVRYGSVVDFVDIGIGQYRWFTFNVADAAISAFILLFAAYALVPRLGEIGRGRPADG